MPVFCCHIEGLAGLSIPSTYPHGYTVFTACLFNIEIKHNFLNGGPCLEINLQPSWGHFITKICYCNCISICTEITSIYPTRSALKSFTILPGGGVFHLPARVVKLLSIACSAIRFFQVLDSEAFTNSSSAVKLLFRIVNINKSKNIVFTTTNRS